MGFATGLLNFFKYLVIGVVTVSIVAGLTNDITHYSNSFMNDSEIKMVKHMDGDRFVASSEKEKSLKVFYLPLDEYGLNSARVNGMWTVYKYEKYGYEVQVKKVSIKLNLAETTGSVRVRQTMGHKEIEIVKRKSSVVFQILSFPNDNDVVLFRYYIDNDGKKNVLKLYARKVMRRLKIFKNLVTGKREFIRKKQKVEQSTDNENYSDPVEMNLVIKNVYHPQKNSGVLEGEHVSGSVKIYKQTIINSDGKIVSKKLTKIEELEVTVNYGGEQGSCDIEIGDVDLHDGNKFSVEISSCDGESVMSHGLVVESGKEVSVLISTGPFNGAALRFTSVENIAEYEKKREAREEMAMLAEIRKEDAELEQQEKQEEQEEIADINEGLNGSHQELVEGESPNDGGSYNFGNEGSDNDDDDYAKNSKGEDPDRENSGYLEADTGKSPVISKKHMVTMVAM